MNWLIGFAASYPRRVLLVLSLLTLGAALLIPRLEVSISSEAITVDGSGRDAYEETARVFGSTNAVVVFVSDAALFDSDILLAIRSAVGRLDGLAFVEGTDSLFSLEHGRLRDDETLVFSPYLEPIPSTPDAVTSVRVAALANAFVAGNLLSPDGRSMAINVRLRPDYMEVFSERAVVDGIDAAIASLQDVVEEVFALGQPHVSVSIADHVVRDQAIILPLSLATLLFVLVFALGHWEGTLIPLLTAIASVLWTLASMVFLGISLNVMTSVVPLLLVVVGSTEDVHMLAAYFARTREGMDSPSAIGAMAAGVGLAVLLTFATTYLGFLSIMLNDIGVLREFGLVASSGLLFNFLITSLFVPSALALRSERVSPLREIRDRYQRIAGRLYRLVSDHQVMVVVVSLSLLVLGAYGASKLRVDNDIMDYLPADSPVLERAQRLHQTLGGIQSFDIVLASGIEGTFERARYLEQIEMLQRFVDDSGYFDKTQSFADVLKEVNRVVGGLAPGERYLPDDDAVVREFLLFLDSAVYRAYVDDELSRTRITVRHNISSSQALQRALAEIERFTASKIDPALHVSMTGRSILTLRAGDTLAVGQAKSLLLLIVAIFVIVAAVFVNLKAGAVAVVPTLLPILLLFGVMGFAGIPLSTGTAMVAAIAVGICVDNTIHFLMRYHEEMASRPTTEEAIRATMDEEARPIMSISLALTLGFGVLALSSFPPVVYFGLLASLVFVLALLATFMITPILLSRVRLVTLWDVLSMPLKTRLMKDCSLFHGMHPFQVRKLLAMSCRKRFDAGEKIVSEGDQSRELFVILEGKVRAQRLNASGDTELLNTMGVGEVFGEIALAANSGRTADALALEATEVLVLHWNDLQVLARYMPRTSSRLIMNIARTMGKRLAARHF